MENLLMDVEWLSDLMKQGLLDPEKRLSPVPAGLLDEQRKAGNVVVHKDVDTMTSGRIYLFTITQTGASLAQEQDTDKGIDGFVWRLFESADDAESFLADRQDLYAALWGGACCEEKPRFDKKWNVRVDPIVCANPKKTSMSTQKKSEEDEPFEPVTSSERKPKGILHSIFGKFGKSSV